MTNFYVYTHHKADTTEIFYVGKGMSSNGWDGNEKFGRAYSTRSRNSFWHNVVKNHGFTVKIVQFDLLEEVAFELEKSLIAKYGRRDLNEGVLVNLTNGGDGVSGYKFTIADKKKHHESLKIAMKGRIFTAEHLSNMSKSRKAKVFNESMRRGIGIGNMIV